MNYLFFPWYAPIVGLGEIVWFGSYTEISVIPQGPDSQKSIHHHHATPNILGYSWDSPNLILKQGVEENRGDDWEAQLL
mgnify:CR=1 FL=1